MHLRDSAFALLLGSLLTAPVLPARAQSPAPGARTASSIRYKISAADLPSAESILEVHRDEYGEDGYWLVGLGWLSRGALLLGETDRARELNTLLLRRCEERLSAGHTLEADDSLETALGAAIEVETQLRARTKGRAAAVEYLRGEIARRGGPVGFRSRLQKRLHLLALAGRPAPEIAAADFAGGKPPTMVSLHGRPVVVYVWSASCGDCRAQAASLGRVAKRYADRGLAVVPLTRYHDDDPAERAREKARIDSVWTAEYAGAGPAAIPIDTESMVAYGGSSTPTFVFVDRRGIVRRYTPTRLTEDALDREVRAILD